MREWSYGFATALLFASVASGGTPPGFNSIEIASLAGPQGNVSAAGLNDRGDIVGISQYPAGSSNASGAFVYYYSTHSELALSGSSAGGINDADNIAGEVIDPSSGPEAVVWSKSGGEQILPTEGVFSLADAISNDGDIIGNIDNGHADNSAVVWTSVPTLHETQLGVLWADPSLPDYATSTASGINGLSHIAGSSTAGQGTDPNTAVLFGIHAFLYKSGKMTDLGALALSGNGSDDSEGFGINNLDQVVGISTTAIPARNSQGQPCADCGVASHAFLWNNGKMSDLGNLAAIPGWNSKADGINDSGEIVGWSDSIVNGSSTHRAFLYASGRMLNLQFYIFDRDPNVRLTEAVGINCQGWIVANGFNVTTPDVSRVYLLIPRGQSQSQCTSAHLSARR
jgi:probable HAF family extracellular repeat protein